MALRVGGRRKTLDATRVLSYLFNKHFSVSTMRKLLRNAVSSLLLVNVLSGYILVLYQDAYSRPLASLSSELSEAAARSAAKSFRRWAKFFRTIGGKASGELIGYGAKSALQKFGIDPDLWVIIREISKKPELINDLDQHLPENKVLPVAKNAYARFYSTRCSKYDKPLSFLHLYRLPDHIVNDGQDTLLEACVALHNIHVTLMWAALKKVPETVPFPF